MIKFPKLVFRKSIPVIGTDKQDIGRVSVQVARELVKTNHAEILNNHPSVIGLRHIGNRTASPNRVVLSSPLKNLIHTASLFAAKSSRMTILNSILFKMVGGKLCVMATDLESYFIGCLESGANYSFSKDEGIDAVCINAKHLSKILSSQNNNFSLHIAKGKDTPAIRMGEFFVEGEDASGFPDIQLHKKENRVYKGTITDIATKLNFVVRALSTNKYRSALCGINFDFNRQQLVGSDGNRMHAVPMVDPGVKGLCKGNKNAIVPPSVMHVAKLLTGDVKIVDNGEHQYAIFNLNVAGCLDCVTGYNTIEGEYPRYWEVVPQHFRNKFTVKTKDLMPILYKAQISNTSDTDSTPVLAEFGNGYLQITTKVGGRIVFQRKVQGIYSGPLYSCVINVSYLIDAIHSMPGDSIDILLQSKKDEAWTLKNNSGYTSVIMPIEIETTK